MLVFKLKHTIDGERVVRSLPFRDTGAPSWNTLSIMVEELFFIPVQDVALAYLDEEGDDVFMSSQSELEDYYSSSSYCHHCYMGDHVLFSMRCVMSLKVFDLAELRQRVQSRTRTPSTKNA